MRFAALVHRRSSVARHWPVALLLLGGCGRGSSVHAPAARPNIVLIVVDTLRADHMSLYGGANPTTPAIDAWAQGGVVYERCSAPSSWTVPSMTALLGGVVHIGSTGFREQERVPLAEILQRAGYHTGAVVANPLLNEENGFTRGFDDYAVAELATETHKASERWLADGVVQQGLAWLERRDARPFFLFLHVFDPHAPYTPSGGSAFEPATNPARAAAFRDALPADKRARWNDQVHRTIERLIASYDSEVLQVDRALQRVFDFLANAHLDDDTLVVLTADHGEGLWQRAAPVAGKDTRGDFFPELYSGHGECLNTEQVHVPLVLRGPGLERAHRSRAEVSLIDVLPTLLARLDLAAPAPLDGLPLDPSAESERVDLHAHCAYATSITERGRWRLHVPHARGGASAAPQLYDLASDPLELRPLDDPERAQTLRTRLDAWRDAHTYRGPALPPSARTLQMMEALGYVGHDER